MKTIYQQLLEIIVNFGFLFQKIVHDVGTTTYISTERVESVRVFMFFVDCIIISNYLMFTLFSTTNSIRVKHKPKMLIKKKIFLLEINK